MDLELLTYVIAVVGAVAILIIIYSTKFKKGKEEDILKPTPDDAVGKWRTRVWKSIPSESAKEAGELLRTLGLEREILSDAIRRLYEAHAEGIISEEEREQLAKRYKSRMMKIRDAITEKESIMALHELEIMQEDLSKLFNDRFEELSNKIEVLRSQVSIETEENISLIPDATPQIDIVQLEQPSTSRTGGKRITRKAQPSRKSKAEERIEKIRSEVDKVLDRLEQMEAEG